MVTKTKSKRKPRGSGRLHLDRRAGSLAIAAHDGR